MKRKYIIGIAVGVIFLALAIYSFDASKIEYADFHSAAEKSKTVQVIGSWVREMPYKYDTDNNIFSFYMKDEKDGIAEVVYKGSKPNNFDMAPMVVVKGKFEGETFMASNVLTKCPSKYEGSMDSASQNY